MHNEHIKIERIGLNKIDEFLSILKELAIWLKENDKEMWNIDKLEKEEFIASNNNSELYVCYVDDEAAGTFILQEQDEFMWQNIIEGESIFLHKLGVRRKYAGKGISKYILEWAKKQTEERNKKFLRLDCYADREYLCNLYESSGFKRVGDILMLGEDYAALYEYEVEKK